MFITIIEFIIFCTVLYPSSKADYDSCLSYDCSTYGKSPINIVTKNVIKVQLPILELQNVYNDTGYTINTGVTLECRVNRPTVANIKGGPLGSDVYIYYKNTFLWTNCSGQIAGHAIDGAGTKLEVQGYWYNQKYGSFQNALNYADGLAVCVSLVLIGKENSGYGYFSEKVRQVQQPKSSVNIEEVPYFKWLVASESSDELLYYFYRGVYNDEGTGNGNTCSYPATIIVPALNETNINISDEQFNTVFGILKNGRGGRLEYKTPIYSAGQVFAAYGMQNYFIYD